MTVRLQLYSDGGTQKQIDGTSDEDLVDGFKEDYEQSLAACFNFRLAVWLSGNALASINVVALRQTRLVLCGRVNHFGM